MAPDAKLFVAINGFSNGCVCATRQTTGVNKDAD